MAGGRTPDVDDCEILALFVDADAPVLFTSEVADALEFSNRGTAKRLRDLEDRGLLVSKTSNDTVWWLTQAGRRHYRRRCQ